MIQLVRGSCRSQDRSRSAGSVTRRLDLFSSLVVTLPRRLSPSTQINAPCLQFQVLWLLNIVCQPLRA